MDAMPNGDIRYKPCSNFSLRGHPTLNEKWLQKLIVETPSLLGLGDLEVKDVERRQPRSGRLDLLLADPDGNTRYEVELQLGATDESHIIRTIEYWDSERRRYPQYEHVAVLVAEDITSRFFNVVSLFNGFIPIIAIQFSALQINDEEMTLMFSTILDHTTLGTDEEDSSELTDRTFWTKKSSPDMLNLVDKLHDLIRVVDPEVELGYRKHYIGLDKSGVANNYVKIIPRKSQVNLDFPAIPQSHEVTSMIEDSGIDTLDYSSRTGYRPIIQAGDFEKYRELIDRLVRMAKENYRT